MTTNLDLLRIVTLASEIMQRALHAVDVPSQPLAIPSEGHILHAARTCGAQVYNPDEPNQLRYVFNRVQLLEFVRSLAQESR